MSDEPSVVAREIRYVLGLEQGWAAQQPTWTDALGKLRERMEESLILVVVNGIVGNNTRRKLNPDEFRGFVLVDNYAPLVFVNGTDAKAAHMFVRVQLDEGLKEILRRCGSALNTSPRKHRTRSGERRRR